MTTTVKTCFKCKLEKPLDDFYKHAQMKDGHLNKCKECAMVDVRKNRVEKIEYYRSYDKLRASMPHRVAARKEYSLTESGKSSHKAANSRWIKKHPERKKASCIVNNAIRAGELMKLPCFICGVSEVEAHHPDYSRPLDVIWLCTRHHKDIHLHMESKFIGARLENSYRLDIK